MHPNLCTWDQRIDDERNEAFPDFPIIAQVYSEAAWGRINSRISLEQIMTGFRGITNIFQRETLLDMWALLLIGHFWRLNTEGERQSTPRERITLIKMRRALERIGISDLDSLILENQDRRAELLFEKREISTLAEEDKECPICSVAFGSPLENGETEQPCRTKCGHFFGDGCIRQWLNQKPGSSCPNCRGEFENLDMLETAEAAPDDGNMPWWLSVMVGEGSAWW
jgi:hypothetical protein